MASFDPNWSDDQILRTVQFPQHMVDAMSPAEKKAAADEFRRDARKTLAPRGWSTNPLPPYAPQKSALRQHRQWGQFLLIGFIALGGIYLFLRPGPSHRVDEVPAMPAGWEELEACSVLESFDEKKEMTLSDDLTAKVEDMSRRAEGDGPGSKIVTEGAWRYDAGSKRYAITFNGDTTTFTLLARADSTSCILFKGDLRAADVSESWFSFPSPEDYEPDR